MKIHVGVPELRGKLERFPFSFVEIQASQSIPRGRVLKAIALARPDLTIALRTAADVLLGTDPEGIEKIARASARAAFVVLPTTHRTGPTKENLRRLSQVADRLRSDTTRVAWEPHGIFEPEEEERWAREAGVVLVRDLTRSPAPPGPTGYARIRAIGTSARPSSHHIDILVDALATYDEAFLIVEGPGALRLRSELLRTLGTPESEEGSDEGDEDELDLEAFEDELDGGEEDDA